MPETIRSFHLLKEVPLGVGLGGVVFGAMVVFDLIGFKGVEVVNRGRAVVGGGLSSLQKFVVQMQARMDDEGSS